MREIGDWEKIVFGSRIPTNYMIWAIEAWDPSRVFIVIRHGWDRSVVYGGLKSDPSSWKLLYDGGEVLIEPIGYYDGIPYMIVYDGDGLDRIIRVTGSRVEEVVGEDKYPLRKAVIVNNRIYAEYLVDASSRLRVFDTRGRLVDEIVFDGSATIKIMDFLWR